MTDLEALLALSLIERMDGIGPEARAALQIAAARIQQARHFEEILRLCVDTLSTALDQK